MGADKYASHWLCLCDCGRIRWVRNTHRLRSGQTKACGWCHRANALAYCTDPNPMRDEIIERRLATGDSCAAIARFFGTTKNTVVGILWRAELIGRQGEVKVSKMKTFSFPGTNRCLYPHGHPGDEDFHFCGERTEPGESYCGTHHALCYSNEKLLPIAIKSDANVVKKKAA